MPPKGRSNPRRRPRRKASARPSVRVLLLALALPTLGAVLWLGYRFLTSSPAPEVVTAVPQVEPAPAVTATVVETPKIESALLDAGVERDRLRWDNGYLVVETFEPIESVEQTLATALPGSRIERQGDLLVATHGEVTERLRVVTLQRGTGDAGFVPVDEESVPPPRTVSGKREGARKIVLILDDVGYDNQPLETAASIDARISFAVIPGTPRARESAEFLAAKGFEILCHLPMEPLDPDVSPGERAIFTAMPDEEIRELAARNIASIPHVRGVNNHMGSRATRDRRVMGNIAEVLRQQGVYFVDSRTAGSSVAAAVMREAKIPSASRDVFLDDDPSEPAVRRQLSVLAKLSESRDFVIGIGHVYPTTVRVLREEIPRLSEAGYEFLFASDVLR